MTSAIRPEVPDLSRRDFVKTLGVAALASTVGPLALSSPTETAVARFYKSLSDDQKASICFAFDHPFRSRVGPNWAVVKPRINDLNPDQKALCREIFKTLCSDDGHGRFLRQMDEDYGGFANYHVAVFGAPGTDQPFEWVITGRHVTLRTNGSSCCGPLFYGHASQGFHVDTRRTGNVWWYQAKRADAIFKTLDAAQQAKALVSRATPGDSLSTTLYAPGLSVGDLDGSQRAMVQDLLKGLLQLFRSFDSDPVQSCLSAPGSADTLRLTYFQNGELGSDGFCDIWKLEGPAFSWYFHGSPHVHGWLNGCRNLAGA